MSNEIGDGKEQCIRCGGTGEEFDADGAPKICGMCEGEGTVCIECLSPDRWCECGEEEPNG